VDSVNLKAHKRREQRWKIVLPLRVSVQSGPSGCSMELAHTLDISTRGARLGAIRQEMQTGTKLLIQYRQRRIQSRIIWVKRLEGTSEHQVGVELLAAGMDAWGIDLNAANTCNEPKAEVVVV
jgi:PilZ domain-containing protein